MSSLGINGGATECFNLSSINEGKFKNEQKPSYFNRNLVGNGNLLRCTSEFASYP